MHKIDKKYQNKDIPKERRSLSTVNGHTTQITERQFTPRLAKPEIW